MTTFTSRGVPLAEATDPADIAARLNPVAQLVHDRPGVSPLTTTQRNALTGVELWDGRLILDTTLDRIFRWDAGTTTWIQVADSSEVAALLATSGTPADLGLTASRGVSSSAARADHVHRAPPMNSMTPNAPNFPLNASASFFRWRQDGKWVDCQFIFTASGAVTGQILIDLPVTPLQPLGAGTNSASQIWGSAMSNDISAGVSKPLHIFYASGVTQRAGLIDPAGTGLPSATFPFTWATGDTLAGTFSYEAA